MSVRERVSLNTRVDTDTLGVAMLRAVFGNYLGATLFLAALAWFGLYWRLGFFSNDQYTFANALLGVADGHLFIDRAVYGPASGASPGTYLVDGRVYGRNYGIVIVSAAWLVALEAVSQGRAVIKEIAKNTVQKGTSKYHSKTIEIYLNQYRKNPLMSRSNRIEKCISIAEDETILKEFTEQCGGSTLLGWENKLEKRLKEIKRFSGISST
jgi:hypothetical protein